MHDVLCLERSEREEWILIMKEAHLNWFLSEFNIRAWRYVKNYRPEKAANVTLIYGQKGLGKTALLCYLYQHGAQLGILTDAMAFARQYAYAAQVNKLDLFRQHYRTTKFLLIDDLQFLEGIIEYMPKQVKIRHIPFFFYKNERTSLSRDAFLDPSFINHLYGFLRRRRLETR